MDEDESRSETTFRYKIENFSQLNGRTLSPTFFVRNIPWRIMAMPRTNQTEDGHNTKTLAFYLLCNNGSNSKKWWCSASVALRLVSQTNGYNRHLSFLHLFHNESNGWGYPQFYNWEAILDPKNGFIKDDAIILEVWVKADEPLGFTDESEVTLSYKIENLSHLSDIIFSPEIVIRNLCCKVMAIPHSKIYGTKEQSYKNMDIFLKCSGSPYLRNWSCNVITKLTLYSEKEGVNSITHSNKFLFECKDRGFYPLSQSFRIYLDPEKGYIKDDSIRLMLSINTKDWQKVSTDSSEMGTHIELNDVQSCGESSYSSNKLNSPKVGIEMDSNHMKRRDFYEERICDDLSEVILQYLSLEDKLRLECVSQQFRRTLFAKHYSLKINRKMREMRYESIENLMKKLPRLLEIYLSRYNDCKNINWKVIKAITQSDIRLTKFLFVEKFFPNGEELNGFEEEEFIKFISKFGSELISLTFLEIPWTFHTPYLEHFSNLKELFVPYVPDLSIDYFKCLKELEIQEFREQDLNRFEVLVDNKITLKRLRICYLKPVDEITIKLLLTSISKLKNLIELRIGSKLLFNSKEFETHLTKIAQNCNQLKSLCIDYTIDEKTVSDLLSSLKRFKALKRLNVFFYSNTVLTEEEINSKFDFSSFNSFETFRGLTHLTIFSIPLIIDEKTIFKDIEKNLPKLQSIRIVGKIKCSEYTAHILSRLSNLQTISIYVINSQIKHQIEAKLKKNCKRIKGIQVLYYER